MTPAQVRAEVRATLREPPDWLWDAFGGSRTLAGTAVSVDSAVGIDAVWAAVNALAGDAGASPLIVYRGRGGSRERAVGDPRWVMLHDRPNPWMQADVYVEQVMAHLLLWGNSYSEKIRRRGVVEELHPVMPGRVRPYWDDRDRKRFEIDGEKGYTPDEILHIPGFGWDGLRGASVITVARQRLGTIQARDEYEAALYGEDATPPGVLKTPKTLSPEKARGLRDQFNALNRGAGKRAMVVLEEGMTWEQVGMPLKDQEFVEASRLTVGQVARLFGLPPERIGGDSGGSLTYGNVEARAAHYVTFSLRRWLVRIEKALKADPQLFPEADVYPEFLLDGLLRGDSKTRAEVYGMAVDRWLTVNEIRAAENRAPLPGGDELNRTAAAPAVGVNGNGNGRVPEVVAT